MAGSIRSDCLRILLRPIVRFCLRGGETIQDLLMMVKLVFIEVAEDEIRKSTAKINVSRLSVMTGLTRREVKAIFKERRSPLARTPRLSARVLGLWQQDKRFTTSQGQAKVLSFEGNESEFHNLVESVSKNLNPATVLFELVRIGAVARTPRGLKLIKDVERLTKDPRAGFEHMSRDVETLMYAVEQNLELGIESHNLHIRTEYDNIVISALPKIRDWLREEGKQFHKRVREFLASHDKDISPGMDEQGGGRVTVIACSYIDSNEARVK